jgi:hypothetical protein
MFFIITIFFFLDLITFMAERILPDAMMARFRHLAIHYFHLGITIGA